ncbi:MAG: hypothetical protein Q9172_002503 [Xanthocarpia lactea]
MVSQLRVVAANEIERLVGAFDRASKRPYNAFGTINPISIKVSVVGPYGLHLLESLVPSKLSK